MRIKKYFAVAAFVIILFVVINTAVTSALGTNLIPNPSMEEVLLNQPKGWLRTKTGNNISVFNYKLVGQDGNRSLYINVTQYVTGSSAWYFKEVPVSPEKEYEYGEYYKSTMETELFVKFIKQNGSSVTASLGKVPKSSDWTSISKKFTTPPDVKSLTVLHSTSSLGELYIDNTRLELTGDSGSPVPPPTPTPAPTPTPIPTPTGNLVPNPSVETVNTTNSNLPQYWTKAKTGTNNAVFTYMSAGAHSGIRALKVQITSFTSGVAYYQFNPVNVTGGEVYDYKFYYKADVYAEIDAEITMQDGSVTYQYLGVSYPSTDWNQYKTRISLPSNARKVRIYSMLYSKGYLITDDFSLAKVTPVPFASPIVTLTFDDAFDSFYFNALPLFKKYNMAGTMYLVSQDFDQPNYMNRNKLLEVYNNGFEIGSHSVTHPHLPLLSDVQVENELKNSRDVINGYLGINIKNFASPYGEYNDHILPIINKYYGSHRSVDVGYNTKDNFEAQNIRAMSTDVNTTPEQVLGWVDEAIRQKAWLVIVYHDITNNGLTWTNTPAHLDKVLSGLSQRGVSVKTIDQGLAEILPQM